MDNLSTAYKEAKPLSNDLFEKDSHHHMTKTYPRPWCFNSGFSSQHLPHLDAITASLGRSSCLYERSPPPKKNALQRTISEQALPRRAEKVLQRLTEGLHGNFWYWPELPGISDAGQRQVVWHCLMWSESQGNHSHHHSLFSQPKTLPRTDWLH